MPHQPCFYPFFTQNLFLSESLNVLYTLPKTFFQIFHGCFLLITELLSLSILIKNSPPCHTPNSVLSVSVLVSLFITQIWRIHSPVPMLDSEIYEGRDSLLLTLVLQHLELYQVCSTCTINISWINYIRQNIGLALIEK